MPHTKYIDIDRLDQLPEEGRELLGHEVYWTVKRDGQNIQFYLADGEVVIGSRNFTYEGGFQRPIQDAILELEGKGEYKEADRLTALQSIIESVKKTKEFPIIVKMLRDNPTWHIYCEHLMKGSGPTRIEKTHRKDRLLLLDIMEEGAYFHYVQLHQAAYQYRMPMPALFYIHTYRDYPELRRDIDQSILPFCRRNRYEGMVGRCYHPFAYFKVKVDLPDARKRHPKPIDGPEYPPIPEEKLNRALSNAFDECKRQGKDYHDLKDIMPLVALHINQECREHFYTPPRNYLAAWLHWKQGGY